MKTTALIIAGLLTLPHSGMSQEKVIDPFEGIMEKKADKLRNRPRLGMTEEELTQLWGKPVRNDTPYFGNPPGLKKQHEKYLPVSLEGKIFRVGNIMLHTGFIDGKAVAIGIGVYEDKFRLTDEEALKIAKSLIKTGFTSIPKGKKDFAIYSSGMKQKYVFQKIGHFHWYQVIDMEALIYYQELKERESVREVVNKDIQGL